MILLAEIEILGLPKLINAIGYRHWAVKVQEARRWKQLVYQQCVFHKIGQLNLQKAELELFRYSSREPDFDNLAGSFKHVIDGLVYAQVLKDDRPSVIGSPKFHWVKEKRKFQRVKIRILMPEESSGSVFLCRP